MYVTNQPCVLCAKMIVNAGIKELIFEGEYPDEMAISILQEAGVQVRSLKS
jgi:dCMP deaminase